MKRKLVLVLFCIIALVVFSVVRDLVIQNVIGIVATNITGAKTRLGGFSLSIIRQSVKIAGFKIYSPKGFPEEVMVDIPLMKVSCDIFALLGGKIHLKEVTLDLKEITLVKNKEGKMNVDSLKVAESKAKEEKPQEAKPAKQMAIQMDLVNLNIGRVISKDYSVSDPATLKVYEVGVKKAYKNITSAQQLAALIVAEPLKAAGIQGLKVYGVAMLTGVAALPVAAVLTFAGKDHAQADFNVSWDKAYEAGLKVLKNSGKVLKEDKAEGTISAEVSGAQVAFKLRKVSEKKTSVTVSARRYMLPKPEIAAGVMYRIQDELK